jgi:hypothetical protein
MSQVYVLFCIQPYYNNILVIVACYHIISHTY